MLTIIHGADFHLDSPFSGLSPQQAAQRRGEQRELLARLAQTARARQADLVLLSGDLLDTGWIFRETAQTLALALGEIPCPVVIAPGNHDFYSSGSIYATLDWPENVHIFSAPEIAPLAFPALNCTVHGCAFVSPSREDSPLLHFRAPRDGQVHLMALHAHAGGAGGGYAPITAGEIAASGLDYLALGHIHQCSGLQWAGATPWAYPGCPEGRGFDETGEKGVLCVQVGAGRATAELIPLCSRRYESVSIDLTGSAQPLDTILAALPGDTSRDIYRILLTGEVGEEFPALSILEHALSPRFYSLRLSQRTRLSRSVWSRMEEDTLTGLFLRAMWDKYQHEPENPAYELAVRFGLSALEHGEDVAL